VIKLSALFHGAGTAPDAAEGDAEILSISADSRHVSPGALFICMPSANSDAHSFIPQAVKSGAVAVLAHTQAGFEAAKSAGVAAALVVNEGLRFSEQLWRICRVFYQNPTREMQVIGVTGTNGKTTTAWLIRDMFTALGVPSSYLGTLGFQMPGVERDIPNTTPFAPDLYAMLAEARDAGVKGMAIEVSSHALSQRRIDGVEFDAAVFTNLSQDHLDFHGSMELYADAKFRLFRELGPRSGKNFRAAINIHDKTGRQWAHDLGDRALTFGRSGADLVGKAQAVEIDHIKLALECKSEKILVDVPLGGTFNVQNCMSATAGMLAAGYSLAQVAEALPKVHPVPGRFEPVPNDKGISIIVDYAHTPDALVKLLDSVRELHPSRILTVFGCGGDRDRTKRPKMAKAASERSDWVYLTSDNPRSEDPESILRDVEKGLAPGSHSESIIDRREAISSSVRAAKPGDIVVIAGKGHENYQIIGRTKFPMDDRQIAREALKA
jgi:UDP-N-acetylmuramoyl-L-alanyl-D-glutamate--2,6-diaminopimelate ligase